MPAMTRRAAIAGAASTALAFGAPALIGRAADLKVLTIAEPVHFFPFLPLYLANDAGLFAKRGIDVKYLNAGGGSHVAALASGQVWGNLGGAESDAMANNGRSDPLIAIVGFCERANVYLCAKKGTAPKSASKDDMKAFFKGKKIALGRYGSTADALVRAYVETFGLESKTDITPVNQANVADAPVLVKSGAADIAIATEPFLSAGVEQGIWEEPFMSFPTILGDYSWSVVSVRKSSITNDRATAQGFVDGFIDALRLIQSNRGAVEASVKKQFPTLDESIAKRALDRCYKDGIWSPTGVITPIAYERDMSSVYKSGELTRKVPFNDVVDMSLVNASNKRK